MSSTVFASDGDAWSRKNGLTLRYSAKVVLAVNKIFFQAFAGRKLDVEFINRKRNLKSRLLSV